MTILKYIAIILTSILAIFAVSKDYKRKKSRKLNKNGKILLGLIIFSVIVSIWTEILSDSESKNKEIIYNANIKSFKQKSDSLKDNINQTRETLNYKISQLENDNYNLSRELTKTSIELNKSILGEGYAIFEVFGSNNQGEYYCGIKSHSKYLLYDISLLVTDFDEAIKCKTSLENGKFFFDQDCFFKNSSNVASKNLPLGLLNYVDYSFHSKSEFKNLEIIFTSRNSHILQQSVYKLKIGICSMSYRIYKFENSKLILISSNNDLGLPDSYWDNNFYPIQNRTLGIYKDKK